MSRAIHPLDGWPHDEPAFHPGEQAVQARFGMRERLAQVGDHIMRGAMPDEHRELLARLPYLVLGALDDRGRPWATLVTGRSGFISTPDAGTIRVAARLAPEDPVARALTPAAPIAVLGIELATRRRNRANGRVIAADAGGLTVGVVQSFGNCPKYIHPRDHVAPRRPSDARFEIGGALLDPAAAALVERANTFFIATASADAGPRQAPNGGVDVSHRGGPTGFVRVGRRADRSVLTIPDYVGNFFFNTLGNVAVNPRAGLLFVDFESGATLQLTGTVEVVWEGAEIADFPGAQRLLRIEVEESVAAR